MAAMHNKQVKSAPRAYVENLFDEYAHSFDVSLKEDLGYSAPNYLANMIRAKFPRKFEKSLRYGLWNGIDGYGNTGCKSTSNRC